jgi:hypothetical protein
MNHPSRTIRVFISSTFRDFAEERNLLVRKVFPELRRKCRERQVELVDVDLRWGITEEEAKQGKILPICLAEIDRSRPYFIGLLGERYGWVPEKDLYEPWLLTEQPWLEEHRGSKSVTELEILHGVLNNPEMAGHAFFYFRDPAWSKRKGGEYLSEKEDERLQLASLKSRIRSSEFPLVEDYTGPEVLAERVRDDLWKLIDKTFPESEVPDALAQERMRHEAFTASRRGLYIGNEAYFSVLNSAMATEPYKPVLVSGESGSGKSALLANWLELWNKMHPETTVIFHHLGCDPDAADPVRMTTRIIKEIAELVDEEFTSKEDPNQLLDDFANWLEKASDWASERGVNVMIVLDGLDRLTDRRNLLWLPTFIPCNVKLVASCLDGDLINAAKTRLDWMELVVEPFNDANKVQFIREYLGRFRKQFTGEQEQVITRHPLSANPLFLRTVIEEMRVSGVHEKLDKRLRTLLSSPPGKAPGKEPEISDAFEHVLARIESDYGCESTQRTLEAIWASRAGLYTDEIIAIANVTPSAWSGIANSLHESIYENTGRINLGHSYLRKAIEHRYAITDERRLELHGLLAKHFEALCQERRMFEIVYGDADQIVESLSSVFQAELRRITEELPWQYQQADDTEKLGDCLTDLDIFDTLYCSDPDLLRRYWVWLAAEDLYYKDIDKRYQLSYETNQSYKEISPRITFNLAMFLQSAGCFTAFVESLHEESLKYAEQKFGFENPNTLASASLYSDFLIEQGNYEKALPLCQRVNLGFEMTFGECHPVTLENMNSLATLHLRLGNYGIACELYRSIASSLEETLGFAHLNTLMSRASLAMALEFQGETVDAEAIYRCVITELVRNHGFDNPTTLSVIGNLAALLFDQHRYFEVEELCQPALARLIAILGSQHPITTRVAHILAACVEAVS